MRLVSKEALAECRSRFFCEACLKYGPVEAAHVFPKGNGRVDCRENLIALGSPWGCACHRRSHDGHEPTRQQLIERVAQRERIDPSCIQEIVWAVRRLPKETSVEEALRVVALLRRPV